MGKNFWAYSLDIGSMFSNIPASRLKGMQVISRSEQLQFLRLDWALSLIQADKGDWWFAHFCMDRFTEELHNC